MRKYSVKRKTKETAIEVKVNLDGTGKSDIKTGIGFLDHMLDQISKHSLIDISIKARGDLHVDLHHTTEDSALALGEALNKALGERKGIKRFGQALSAMDETLSRVVVDNSNFEIIPGQLMTVKIIYDEINQIGVPESAITIQGNTAFVYTVNGETAEKKNIEIGKRNFGKVSVISGLNEGDLVISEGVSKVRDKGKIKIISSAK